MRPIHLVSIRLILALFCFITSTPAQAIEGEPAPEWHISEWLNGSGVTLEELKGQVVVVAFFQLWCPGCKRFSIPLMKTWQKHFARPIRQKKLFMLSIHSVFEGHEAQNPARLRAFVKKQAIRHLVGIDRHPLHQEIPMTMRLYHTRGTPEMVIIDKKGIIRFQRFGGFDHDEAEQLIKLLLLEKA